MNNWLHRELQESTAIEKLRELSDPIENYTRIDRLYRSLEVRERLANSSMHQEARSRSRVVKDYKLKDNHLRMQKPKGIEYRNNPSQLADTPQNKDSLHQTLVQTGVRTYYSSTLTPPNSFLPYRTTPVPFHQNKYQGLLASQGPKTSLSYSLELTKRGYQGSHPGSQQNPQMRLELYRRVRKTREQQMVVMGSISKIHQFDQNEHGCNRREQKKRKGRIWHGRPPVKIIAQF